VKVLEYTNAWGQRISVGDRVHYVWSRRFTAGLAEGVVAIIRESARLGTRVGVRVKAEKWVKSGEKHPEFGFDLLKQVFYERIVTIGNSGNIVRLAKE
jgi:hypothetical protein